jgi:hypothetical protein
MLPGVANLMEKLKNAFQVLLFVIGTIQLLALMYWLDVPGIAPLVEGLWGIVVAWTLPIAKYVGLGLVFLVLITISLSCAAIAYIQFDPLFEGPAAAMERRRQNRPWANTHENVRDGRNRNRNRSARETYVSTSGSYDCEAAEDEDASYARPSLPSHPEGIMPSMRTTRNRETGELIVEYADGSRVVYGPDGVPTEF